MTDTGEPTPRRVAHAVAHLWLSAAIALIFSAAIWLGFVALPSAADSKVMNAVVSLLTSAFLGFFAWKISARRNWARWLFAIVTAFGAVSLALAIFFAPEMWRAASGLLWGVALVQTVLQVAAVIFLFSMEARQWFGQKGAAL